MFEELIKPLFDAVSCPALLIGGITFLGLALQRLPFADVVKGAVKAALGFVVLSCGAGILVSALSVFGTLFEKAFELRGVVPNNEAFVAILLGKYGIQISVTMLLGMVGNVFLARITPFKYIFLTGHHILFMAALLVVLFNLAGYSSAVSIAVSSVLLALTLTLLPAAVQWVMRKVTQSDDFALGHFGSLGGLFAALIGKLVGRGSRSTEDFVLPKTLMFFRETTVSIVVTMLPLFLIVSWYALRRFGVETFNQITGAQQGFVIFSLMQALTFAAGIYIVLQGVRLILGEILPAFKGISDKLVPDAKPALDCPIVFPYAPNAVILGFLSSFVGGLIGLAICGAMSWTIVLPGVIPHFFCGATAGVFGNATGGRRGCVVGAFAHGILITLLPLLLIPAFGEAGFVNTTFGDTDLMVVGGVLNGILELIR